MDMTGKSSIWQPKPFNRGNNIYLSTYALLTSFITHYYNLFKFGKLEKATTPIKQNEMNE